MRKVKRCFGRYGERECLSVFCNNCDECIKFYSNYFNKFFDANLNRFRNFNLRREIEKYMKENKIKFTEIKKR